MKKGFTTAALGVAIVVFLTFGFMPGQVEPERWDCEHADAINTNPRAWSAAARNFCPCGSSSQQRFKHESPVACRDQRPRATGIG